MVHLKRLCERVGFEKGHPAGELVLRGQGEKYDYISVFAGEGFVMAYTVNGRQIVLSLEAFQNKNLEAYWMDPVTGMYSYVGKISGGGEAVFSPPEREDSTDIVLVALVVGDGVMGNFFDCGL